MTERKELYNKGYPTGPLYQIQEFAKEKGWTESSEDSINNGVDMVHYLSTEGFIVHVTIDYAPDEEEVDRLFPNPFVFIDFYSRGEEEPFFRIKVKREDAEQIIKDKKEESQGEIEGEVVELKED